MRIRTSTDLGAFIRERRISLGWDQTELANQVGASRKWVSEVERGKPRAEMGLILRALKTLGVSINLEGESPVEAKVASQAVNINQVLNALKGQA